MDDARRCTARRSSGQGRCRKAAILGGTVCQTHGGGAPQVKKKARERLAEMVDPALSMMTRFLEEALGDDDPLELSTAHVKLAEAVLDRAGHPRRREVDVTAEARQVVEVEGERIAAAMMHFARALGLDTTDPEVRSAARAALMSAADPDDPPPAPPPRALPPTRPAIAQEQQDDEEPDTITLRPKAVQTPGPDGANPTTEGA